MTIYPAIDLYNGKVVRLTRGDYSLMTVYSDDPVSVARGFKEAGALAAHIVDLEGARDGKPVNYDTINNIIIKSGLDIQVGGGIRDLEVVEKYIQIGAKRVILGTAAVSAPGFLKEAVEMFPGAIAVSADIKDGFIAIKGWTELSGYGISEFCQQAAALGVRTLICTDVSKDGLLCGANQGLYRTLREETHMYLVASGGISTLDDIRALSELGVDGAILGKALYEGKIDLAEAIGVAAKPDRNQ